MNPELYGLPSRAKYALDELGRASLDGIMRTRCAELSALPGIGLSTVKAVVDFAARHTGIELQRLSFSRIRHANLTIGEALDREKSMTDERAPKKVVGAITVAPRCDGCRFWLHLDPAITGVADGEGECRRRAPSPVSQFRDDMASPNASWPLTFKDDWCGEHEAKA